MSKLVIFADANRYSRDEHQTLAEDAISLANNLDLSVSVTIGTDTFVVSPGESLPQLINQLRTRLS